MYFDYSVSLPFYHGIQQQLGTRVAETERGDLRKLGQLTSVAEIQYSAWNNWHIFYCSPCWTTRKYPASSRPRRTFAWVNISNLRMPGKCTQNSVSFATLFHSCVIIGTRRVTYPYQSLSKKQIRVGMNCKIKRYGIDNQLCLGVVLVKTFFYFVLLPHIYRGGSCMRWCKLEIKKLYSADSNPNQDDCHNPYPVLPSN